MNAPPKRGGLLDWKAVLGILISVALLYWALRNEPFGEIVEVIRNASLLWFSVAVFFATIVFWLRAWRWKPLLDAAFPDTSFRTRLAATTIGFMGNNLLPARVGEFMRAYALARSTRGSVVAAFASLLVERLFDAIIIIAFLALTLMLSPEIAQIKDRDFSAVASTMSITIGVLILICGFLVVFPKRTVDFFEKFVLRFMPQKVRRPLVDALEAFLAGLASLRSPLRVSVVTVQSVVLWLVNALGFWFAFRAFGIDVPFVGALFIQSVIALAVSVPSGPGFFGPFEVAAKLVLVEAYGVDSTRAIAFALGFHLGGFIPVTLIGLYYAWKMGLSWGDVEKSEDVVETAVERELPVPPDGHK